MYSVSQARAVGHRPRQTVKPISRPTVNISLESLRASLESITGESITTTVMNGTTQLATADDQTRRLLEAILVELQAWRKERPA